jgi:transposase
MAYSIDFRRAALDYWGKGHSEEELYEAFGIYPSRIIAWRKLLKETGSLEPQYKETRKRKIDIGKLTEAVERKPDATLGELAKIFDCTESGIFYALKRAKLPLKKNSSHMKNNVRMK